MTKPIDMTPWLSKPCAMVDSSLIATFGAHQQKQDLNSKRARTITGPTCDWEAKKTSDPDIGLSIGTVAQQKAPVKGLDGVYQSYKQGLTDFFKPVEIPGHSDYPAVISGKNDEKKEGTCNLYVGVRDDLGLAINSSSFDDPNYAKACKVVTQVAKSALDNLTTH